MFQQTIAYAADEGSAVTVPERPKLTKKQRRAIKAVADAARYAGRKERGECIRACGRDAIDGSNFCAECGPVVKEQDAAAHRRRRDKRRRAEVCTECGLDPKRKTVISLAPIAPVSHRQAHAERVAARTSQTFEAAGEDYNAGTRSRYHGKHRGHPSRAEEDEWDMRAIHKEIEAASVVLATYHSPQVQELPRIQRDAVLAEMIAHLELADRFRTELVERAKRRLK